MRQRTPLLLAVLALCAFSPISFKHVHLLRSSPAADTTLATPPAAIRLWFSERLQLAVSSVHIVDASNHSTPVSALHQDAAAGSPVVADITGTLGAGHYTVNWRAMARDGHVVSGHFAFATAGAASH